MPRGRLMGGIVAAAALLLASPGHLDTEAWSRYDPRWRLSAAFLAVLYVALAGLLARRWRASPLAWLLPLAWAAPVAVAAPLVTAWPGPTGLAPLAAALLLAVLATAGLRLPPRALLPALLFPTVGLASLALLRQGELRAQEEVVVSGRVELLLRDLARRIGDDTARHGPPADGDAWLRRLQAPGWRARHGLWWWAPADGVAPGPVRLRYTPPEPGASLWAVVLRTEPTMLRDPRARPFEATITLDGGIAWSWPAGPPAAVAARRAAAPP